MVKVKAQFLRPHFPRGALSDHNLEFWVGRESQIDRVVRGLLASTDAHYIITGYHGVGKTSFVSRVIKEWRRLSSLQGINRVLIFNLQFAQPTSPEDIMRRVIGKVYFGSVDGQFTPNKLLAERLKLNFIQASSKSVKEVQSEKASKDRGGEVNAKLPSFAHIPGNELKLTVKGTRESNRSLEIQHEYNLSAAISDFESVLHLLSKPDDLKRWRFWPFRKKDPTYNHRVLFIFDQIDDLERIQELTSLFSMPNASFIVLGSIKLKEQIASVQEKGSHILEDFQEEYLPCQWNQADKLLSLLISEAEIGSRRFADYRDYLNFFGQGLPRRLLTAIDQHSKQIDDRFFLQLTEPDVKRVQLCAKLHRIIWKNRKRILGNYIDSVQHHLRDKALRGAYHLTDRIFRVARFSYKEASVVVTQISDTIIHNQRERVLSNLLQVFIQEGLILKKGSTYGLAEDVLKVVKQIPDWLKDGFVDAGEILAHFDSYNTITIGPSEGRFRSVDEGSSDDSESRSSTETPLDESDYVMHTPGSEGTGLVKADSRVPLEGTNIGAELNSRYQIEKVLGRGGMSTVYLARDLRLHAKRVVIKVLHKGFLTFDGGRWMRKKFLQEVEALARVDHPGVIGVLDAGETSNGYPYFVMQFVEGKTLRSAMKPTGMNFERVANIVRQIGQALNAAHSRGIYHRDLKPENIMLQTIAEKEEVVKLIDFGIATVIDSKVAEAQTETKVAGTVAYMAPEQLMGKPAEASDIFAFAVISYEMLTGRRPFEPSSPFEMLELQRKGISVKPKDLRVDLPEAAQSVILKSLSFDPERRHSEALAFAEELARALTVSKLENLRS